MKRLGTFQLLCDCLASWNTDGETAQRLRHPLRGGNIRWESLVELANRHLLCPALYAALNHRSLIGCIPAELRQYLALLYEGNGERNRRLLALTRETVTYLNEVGVEPVLLKGTANLCSGLYPDLNTRFLSDIDLLVPKDSITDCVNRLQQAGYNFLFEPETWFKANHVHHPPLLKRNEYIYVELHAELVPEKYRGVLPGQTVIQDATLFLIDDARARMPSANHRLIHNAVHAQLTDKSFAWGDIQLRQLYDFVLLAHASGSQVNWLHIAQLFRQIDSGALSGYLLAGRRFFGYPPPRTVRETMSARAYVAWLSLQINHSWLMRVGSLRRIFLLYCERLCRCIATRRIPKIWDKNLRWRHYRAMASMLNRSW